MVQLVLQMDVSTIHVTRLVSPRAARPAMIGEAEPRRSLAITGSISSGSLDDDGHPGGSVWLPSGSVQERA